MTFDEEIAKSIKAARSYFVVQKPGVMRKTTRKKIANWLREQAKLIEQGGKREGKSFCRLSKSAYSATHY